MNTNPPVLLEDSPPEVDAQTQHALAPLAKLLLHLADEEPEEATDPEPAAHEN